MACALLPVGRFRGLFRVKTAEEDEASPLNLHVQAFVRAERDDGAVGVGILEQLIIGPSATLGFTLRTTWRK